MQAARLRQSRQTYEELGLWYPQPADNVRPSEVGGALQSSSLDGAQNALLQLFVASAAAVTARITVPWAIRDAVRPRAIARLVHGHVALVAENDLVVILPFTILADGAKSSLLEIH